MEHSRIQVKFSDKTRRDKVPLCLMVQLCRPYNTSGQLHGWHGDKMRNYSLFPDKSLRMYSN